MHLLEKFVLIIFLIFLSKSLTRCKAQCINDWKHFKKEQLFRENSDVSKKKNIEITDLDILHVCHY